MVAVKLLRTIGVLLEEYGRIRFDGCRFYYDRLSCIFVKYLEPRVVGADRKRYLPERGMQFLQNLKNPLADSTLQVSDILGE